MKTLTHCDCLLSVGQLILECFHAQTTRWKHPLSYFRCSRNHRRLTMPICTTWHLRISASVYRRGGTLGTCCVDRIKAFTAFRWGSIRDVSEVDQIKLNYITCKVVFIFVFFWFYRFVSKKTKFYEYDDRYPTLTASFCYVPPLWNSYQMLTYVATALIQFCNTIYQQ